MLQEGRRRREIRGYFGSGAGGVSRGERVVKEGAGCGCNFSHTKDCRVFYICKKKNSLEKRIKKVKKSRRQKKMQYNNNYF